MSVLYRTAGIAVVLVSACLLGKNTYTYPKGNIPVDVVNASAYPVCNFDILPPPDRKHELSWDPLTLKNPPAEVSGDATTPTNPVEPIQPGHTLSIALKPGNYRIEARSCDQRYTGEVVIAVTGPTAVTLGPRKQNAPTGVASFALPLAIHTYGAPPTTSEPAQANEPAAQPTNDVPSGPSCLPDGSHTGDYGQCCSRSWKPDNTGHYICCTQGRSC